MPMFTLQLPLPFTPSQHWAVLRELTGQEELVAWQSDLHSAIQLIDRLLIEMPAALPPGCASSLTAADRDRVLAALYQQTFGATIESTIRCRHCGARFDVRFALPDLIQQLDQTVPSISINRTDDGQFQLANGCQFRLPTGVDEYAILGLPPDQAIAALFARCITANPDATDPTCIQTAMQEVAPLLDLDVEAICPECHHSQSIHFDMQSYLLRALVQDQPRLMQEIHRLAIAYGWSFTEIASLPRRHRRTLVALIDAETTALARRRGR